jgi:hypothetical protein
VNTRWIVVLGTVSAVIVIGGAAIVGYVAEPEPPVIVAEEGLVPHYFSSAFNWELAALALAGLGTLALAIATGTLAASTWQDVRASQALAVAAAEQLQIAREANELTRSEQDERLRPAVIAAVEAPGSAFKWEAGRASGHITVELHNVGGGPAVRIEVGAVYTRSGLEAWTVKVQGRTFPTLGPGSTLPIVLWFTAPTSVRDVDFSAFRVVGRYLDRLGNPAGDIVDWKHTTVEAPVAKATAQAPPPTIVTEDGDAGT